MKSSPWAILPGCAPISRGSIADAKILNPILNADGASSRITDFVFDGLLDMDENLNLRGRLATDWSITEKAYLLARPEMILPDGSPATGERLLEVLSQAQASGSLPALDGRLLSLRLLPVTERTETLTLVEPDEQGNPSPTPVEVTIRTPQRVEFILNAVDQDFFTRLTPLLGAAYFQDFPYADHITVADAALREKVQPQFPAVLPVAEHNPIILFHLRQGVRFHDGHPFDAGDVKFTYEAIMNPRNISPRPRTMSRLNGLTFSIPIQSRSPISACIRRPLTPGRWAFCPSIC